ncbi:M23 family metallopeptidase [Nonomuraea candida]|uniref:M23 family metallopeptidase n=1 Tax=Nonomuraea candida TaxID=359159 RepID=UPI0005BA3156|nr:M23 family metallopeptidase [Nonomuraea candida]
MTGAANASATANTSTTANASSAAVKYQLPFPCDERWYGDASLSSKHRSQWEIDFNGTPSDGNADRGRTVVAAAAGTVVMSEYRTTDGFGNVVKIRHADGTVTLYAHLNSRSVANGARVAQGQKIGTLGNTSAKYKGIISHLHFELRNSAGATLPASFNGSRFAYPKGWVTSKNCGGGGSTTPSSRSSSGNGGGSNPYTAEQVCGAGYKQIDSAALGSQGRVVLLYSAASAKNCVVTLRNQTSGKAAMTAYLEVQGHKRGIDSGSFQYYAGPVQAKAPKTCVKWGGSIGGQKYDSPFEHCG